MGIPLNTPDTGEIVIHPTFNPVRELVDALKYTAEQRTNDYGGTKDAIPAFLQELRNFVGSADLKLDMFKIIFLEGRAYLPRQDQLEVISAMVDIENLTNNIQYDPFVKGMVVKDSVSLEETNKYIKDSILKRWPNATVTMVVGTNGEFNKTVITSQTMFEGITAEITLCDDIRFYTFPPMLPKLAGLTFSFTEEAKIKFGEDLLKYVKDKSKQSDKKKEVFTFEDNQKYISEVFEISKEDLAEISTFEDLESLLKSQFRKLALKYHPDSLEPTRDIEKFKRLNEANEKLIKKHKLARYVRGERV